MSLAGKLANFDPELEELLGGGLREGVACCGRALGADDCCTFCAGALPELA